MFWFCVSNLVVAALAAQCSNPTSVPNGTYTSGDHSAADNNALSATNFVISGSATATFVAGNCIQFLPGFRATAGTAGNTLHAWVETAPSAVSVSPTSGTGLSRSFIWTVSSPSGYGNLADVFALFNTSVSGLNACYIRYNQPLNLIYLYDDLSAAWIGGFLPLGSGTASNPQCSINAADYSVSPSGGQLTITATVNFQSALAGTQNNYLIAYDQEGLNSEWQQVGTWTVPTPPITVSVSP